MLSVKLSSVSIRTQLSADFSATCNVVMVDLLAVYHASFSALCRSSCMVDLSL